MLKQKTHHKLHVYCIRSMQASCECGEYHSVCKPVSELEYETWRKQVDHDYQKHISQERGMQRWN